VTKVPLSQVEPDPLHRIEFGAVGRQIDQRDVVWNTQRMGNVPAGLIGDKDRVLIRRELRREQSRKICMASVDKSGSTSAKLCPVAGRTAANRCAHVYRWSQRPGGRLPRVNQRWHTRPFWPKRASS